MPSSKWRRLPLTLETKSLLPSTHSRLILAASMVDFVLAAGDARPDQGSVMREHFHGAEADLGIAGRLEDQVGLAHLLGQLGASTSAGCSRRWRRRPRRSPTCGCGPAVVASVKPRSRAA